MLEAALGGRKEEPDVVTLDERDIQGLVFGGYPKLPAARYLLVDIGDPVGGRAWLDRIAGKITTGKAQNEATGLNIALTCLGLARLGACLDLLGQFSREFQEGMVTEHRQRILGDEVDSDPVHWAWGSPDKPPVHLLLMLFAKSSKDLEEYSSLVKADLKKYSLTAHTELTSTPSMMTTRKEHFGFHDGIAQPQMADAAGSHLNSIRKGEFILGYENEYGLYPVSPLVAPHADPGNLLNAHPSGKKDLGKNGTYLVFRQLSQDVLEFWKYMDANSQHLAGSSSAERRVLLASKCVGRWPSGAPLVLSADKDNPALEDKNDFHYAKNDPGKKEGPDDPQGERCPFGSHVRRTNPRDALTDDKQQSITVVKRHRILRRGRSYGPPIADSMDPEDILKAEADGKDRGLCFICLNADISRQFEFIQQTWINNPKFAGLYNDADPLMGAHDPPGQGVFTLQASLVSNRVTGLSRFVHVRGGAYFFMPGLKALRYLAVAWPNDPARPSPVPAAPGVPAP